MREALVAISLGVLTSVACLLIITWEVASLMGEENITVEVDPVAGVANVTLRNPADIPVRLRAFLISPASRTEIIDARLPAGGSCSVEVPIQLLMSATHVELSASYGELVLIRVRIPIRG